MSEYDNYQMGTYAGDPDAPWNIDEPECNECGEPYDEDWTYFPYCGARIDWSEGDRYDD